MANLIAIVGEPGTGKSYSLRSLDPEETVIISVAGKPLPIRGWKKKYLPKKNYFETSNHIDVIKILKNRAEQDWVKNIVIDDARYLMSFKFMELKHLSGYDKFNDIGDAGFGPVNVARKLPGDKNIIFAYHPTTPEKYDEKIRIHTSGKLVDNHIQLDGMFTIELFTNVRMDDNDNVHYEFLTNDGVRTCAKSPPGMFEDQLIPNDMKFVLEKVHEYYEG
jgi:hypothetical protein